MQWSAVVVIKLPKVALDFKRVDLCAGVNGAGEDMQGPVVARKRKAVSRRFGLSFVRNLRGVAPTQALYKFLEYLVMGRIKLALTRTSDDQAVHRLISLR